MPSPQLAQLKNQLTQELSQLTTSFAQLRAAQAKFRECINNIRDGVAAKKEGLFLFLKPPALSSPHVLQAVRKRILCLVYASLCARPRWQKLTGNTWIAIGTPILVPLTSSLYVPGQLASNSTVMVDVGTGFYVEKVIHLTYKSLLAMLNLYRHPHRLRPLRASSIPKKYRN